jgi:predicted nucleic acid-binding protein
LKGHSTGIDLPADALVLVDSSALVYLIEGAPGSPRRSAVELFFEAAAARHWRVIASTLIWAELLEKPLAAGSPELAARYRGVLCDSSRIELNVVDVAVAERAAALFASFSPSLRRALSPADVLHIATAIVAGAAAVFGNDEAWRDVPHCPPLILVDELAHDIGWTAAAKASPAG